MQERSVAFWSNACTFCMTFYAQSPTSHRVVHCDELSVVPEMIPWKQQLRTTAAPPCATSAKPSAFVRDVKALSYIASTLTQCSTTTCRNAALCGFTLRSSREMCGVTIGDGTM